MRKAFSLLLAIALLAICTACQPTPEEEYVPQRDGDLIEEKLQAGNPTSLEQTPEPKAATSYKEYVETYKASLPQHWTETLDSDAIKLSTDADIIVNNTDSFPVYTVTRGRFDMKKMEDIANNFFQGVTGIRPGNKPSEREYADAIASLNERNMMVFAQEYFDVMQYASKEEYKDTDCITFTQGSSQAYIVRLADGTSGEIYFTKGDGDGAYMFFDSRMQSILHDKETIETVGGSYAGEGLTTLTPSITEEQGEEIVNAFIRENELEGFAITAATEARHYDFLHMQEISQGWKFTLMRTYGYQAINTTGSDETYGWLLYEDDSTYSQPWRRETVVVYASENGVEFFSWEYPLEITGIAAENAELLDFEQIQNSIRKLLPVCINNDVQSGWRGEISKIMLTAVPQQAKDAAETAYLMPVWVMPVYWYWNNETVSSTYILFGINALDGSRAILRQEDW